MYKRTEAVVMCSAGGTQLFLLEAHLCCRTKSPAVYRSTDAHSSHISTIYQVSLSSFLPVTSTMSVSPSCGLLLTQVTSVLAFVFLKLLVRHHKEFSLLKILSGHFQVLRIGVCPGVNPGKHRKLIVEMVVFVCCFLFYNQVFFDGILCSLILFYLILCRIPCYLILRSYCLLLRVCLLGQSSVLRYLTCSVRCCLYIASVVLFL